MSQLGFIEQLLDNTNYLYGTMLKQFAWYKKVMGTKVTVTRIKERNKYKTVFGSVASSTIPDDSDAEKFQYTVLISLNDMLRLYQETSNSMTFYDNEDKLELGDILSFSRKDMQYKFKITEIQTFSEADNVLRQYTIAGLADIETGIK
jgi:hypothetical protein